MSERSVRNGCDSFSLHFRFEPLLNQVYLALKIVAACAISSCLTYQLITMLFLDVDYLFLRLAQLGECVSPRSHYFILCDIHEMPLTVVEN